MALKYLAGERIQGTAAERAALTVAASPTYEADFETADGWVVDTAGSFSIDTTNETLDFHVQRASTIYDIGKDLTGSTLSQNGWVLRFKMVVNSLTTAGSGAGAGIIGVFGVSSVDSSSESGSLDAIGMKLVFSSNSEERIIGLVTPNQGNFTQTQTNLTTTGLATGTYYVELKRNSQTEAELSFSDGNDYNGDLFTTQTATIANSLENLRYLNWKTFTGNPSDPDNHMHGEISELKFWNNMTSTVTPPELTNGTIFEESDTGKIYMFDGTDTWNEM